MIKRIRKWAKNKIQSYSRGIDPSTWLLNLIFQKILRYNCAYDWSIHFTSRVNGRVVIGDGVEMSFATSGHCYIQGINGVYIGDETIFAPGVKIISANHSKGNLHKWDKCDAIRVGKRCWIGANAIILPGVTLGDDVIVGAGSVVTKSFPAGATVVGVPAKMVSVG